MLHQWINNGTSLLRVKTGNMYGEVRFGMQFLDQKFLMRPPQSLQRLDGFATNYALWRHFDMVGALDYGSSN